MASVLPYVVVTMITSRASLGDAQKAKILGANAKRLFTRLA